MVQQHKDQIQQKTDEYTKLLLHLNSDFTDSCGKTVTANGNAQISTTQKKFGRKFIS